MTHQQSVNVIDMSATLNNRELRTWEKLQTVTEQLRRETGRVLSTEAGLSPPEFTVLAHLAAAGGAEGVRSSLCARAIGWDTSRLSHQLRRLEQRGYVVRSGGDGGDGRASVVALTAEGRRIHRRALGPHLSAAKHWFAAALTEKQLDGLYDALDTLERHIAREVASPDGVHEKRRGK